MLRRSRNRAKIIAANPAPADGVYTDEDRNETDLAVHGGLRTRALFRQIGSGLRLLAPKQLAGGGTATRSVSGESTATTTPLGVRVYTGNDFRGGSGRPATDLAARGFAGSAGVQVGVLFVAGGGGDDCVAMLSAVAGVNCPNGNNGSVSDQRAPYRHDSAILHLQPLQPHSDDRSSVGRTDRGESGARYEARARI